MPAESSASDAAGDDALAVVAAEARACVACAAYLPLGPRPIFQLSTTARVLIFSQAPGTKAHVSGTPFMDPSGVRLRSWLAMDEATFYDASRVAILPVGFCYPGRLPNGGDAAPRVECAALWRPRIEPLLAGLRLTLLVGGYSQAHALGPGAMTDRVRAWRAHLADRRFPLPHPSWRTGAWERRNPWFQDEVVPALRAAVADALSAPR